MGPSRAIRVGFAIAVVVLILPFFLLTSAHAAPQTTSQACIQSGTGVFHNSPFTAQSSQFTVSFAAKPNQNGMYGLIGFSLNAATVDDSLAAFVRFAPNGRIDVRNGTNFGAAANFPYQAGQQYQF